VSADLGRLHEDVCDARGHAGVPERQQPERERRHSTVHADAERRIALAPGMDEPDRMGAGPGRVDRLVQHEVLAFGPWISDAVSDRTRTPSQPQHSVRGRLTIGEHCTVWPGITIGFPTRHRIFLDHEDETWYGTTFQKIMKIAFPGSGGGVSNRHTVTGSLSGSLPSDKLEK
jgi:hypothetical protein